jgi:hypothetical protein
MEKLMNLSTPMYSITQGDTQWTLEGAVTDSNGNVINLTTAVSVTFNVKSETGAQILSNSASVISASGGIVGYTSSSNDIPYLIPGIYTADFTITFSSGQILTAPTYPKIILTVHSSA